MMDDIDVLSDLDQLRSRYEILRRLGNDGIYAVYAARSRGTERHFAVKLIDDPAWRLARSNTRYVWQAHTVEALDHPNLMHIHAVHHLQDGTVGVAMERRRGNTLAERIDAEGALPVRHVEHILRDIADALGYLHSRGVVHRGVRPQSIILDRDAGRARLAPFGIDPAHGDAAVVPQATLLLEALRYIAPEQIRGKAQVDGRALSPQSDIYSLGLVGYAMLAGASPWVGDSTDEVITKQKRDTPRPLAELRPDAPAYLVQAIEGCLAKEPRRRWASAAEFVARLDPAVEASSAADGSQGFILSDRIVTTLADAWGALAGQHRAAAHSRLALVFPAAILLFLGVLLGRTGLTEGGDDSAWAGRGAEDVPETILPAPVADGDARMKMRKTPGPTTVVFSPPAEAAVEVDADLGVDREPGHGDDLQARAPARREPSSRLPAVERRLVEDNNASNALVILGAPVIGKAAPNLLGDPVRLAARVASNR